MVGRVARLDFSTQNRGYWWPRRKVGDSPCAETQQRQRREHSTQALPEKELSIRRVAQALNKQRMHVIAPRDKSIHDPHLDENTNTMREGEETDERHQLARDVLLNATYNPSKAFHILGTGRLGNFAAYCLADMPEPPPVILLLHQPHKFQQWHDEGNCIEFIHNGAAEYCNSIDVQYTDMKLKPNKGRHMYTTFAQRYGFAPRHDDWAIEKLIVTTNAFSTVSALQSVRARLGPRSTICFLNQGLGVIDKVNRFVFPNAATRPQYVLGMVTHGIQASSRNFGVVQTREGATLVSSVNAPPKRSTDYKAEDGAVVVKRMHYGWNASTSSMFHNLVRCTALQARGIPWPKMLGKQWERLAIDSMINPLSVIFDCRYSDLLSNPAAGRLISKLATETVEVIQSLPELQQVPGLKFDFTVRRLQSIAYETAKKLGDNESPMLQNMRSGHKTEIDYLNGHIINKGAEVGLECYEHKTVVEMVKAKQHIARKSVESHIPFG